MSHPELKFFNSLSGKLEVALDVPPRPIGELLNVAASPDAHVLSVQLHAKVFDPDTNESRHLTEAELDSVAFKGRQIRLRSDDDEEVVVHDAPNGQYFMVRDLLQAVEDTERRARSRSEWFGGVDVHHVFFEGIELEEDGVWSILWGS